jgi:coenzyme F420 hydrogenase subunit beta
VDPFKGNVLAAFVGQAADQSLLESGQSGGVVTALLGHLLQSQTITDTVVTQMPGDGSLRPRPLRTADAEEIVRAQGSKYCPVPVNSALTAIPSQRESRTALVGLSCHFHGLRNAQGSGQPWAGQVSLALGLICEGFLSFWAMEHLIALAGIPVRNAKAYRFKSKKWNGWPGDGCVEVKEGGGHCVPNHHRLQCKEAFASLRCKLCFDKMNVLSDLTFGDAWGVKESRQGYSVILARTARGLAALQSACKAGALRLEPVDPSVVFAGQVIEDRRRQWSGFLDSWRRMGKTAPEMGIADRWMIATGGTDRRAFRKRLVRMMRLAESESPQQARRLARSAIAERATSSVLRSLLHAGKRVFRRVLGFPGRS